MLGTISDAQETEVMALSELWPHVPHQTCQFHLLRSGRRIAFYDWWEADPQRWQQFEKMAQQVSPDLWRQMRKETTSAQSEQLKRFRFRHKRATYLATLEDRWAAAAQSALLP